MSSRYERADEPPGGDANQDAKGSKGKGSRFRSIGLTSSQPSGDNQDPNLEPEPEPEPTQ